MSVPFLIYFLPELLFHCELSISYIDIKSKSSLRPYLTVCDISEGPHALRRPEAVMELSPNHINIHVHLWELWGLGTTRFPLKSVSSHEITFSVF